MERFVALVCHSTLRKQTSKIFDSSTPQVYGLISVCLATSRPSSCTTGSPRRRPAGALRPAARAGSASGAGGAESFEIRRGRNFRGQSHRTIVNKYINV